jgi:hypothetical protein
MKGTAMDYVQLPSGTILETNDPRNWPEATKLSKAKGKAAMRAEAIERLRQLLRPGDTIYTSLEHVSASGMSRRISLYVIRENEPIDITGNVGRACDYRRNDRDGGLIVGGAGMDMGFAVVYALGRTLWPAGDGATVTGRNGDKGPETDGGYLLKHRWL